MSIAYEETLVSGMSGVCGDGGVLFVYRASAIVCGR